MCDGDSAVRPACLSASCAYRKTQQSTNSSSFTCRLKWFQQFNYLWAPILKAGASCQFPYSPKALCSALHVFVVCVWFLHFDFLKLQHSCSRKAEAVSGPGAVLGFLCCSMLAEYSDKPCQSLAQVFFPFFRLSHGSGLLVRLATQGVAPHVPLRRFNILSSDTEGQPWRFFPLEKALHPSREARRIIQLLIKF